MNRLNTKFGRILKQLLFVQMLTVIFLVIISFCFISVSSLAAEREDNQFFPLVVYGGEPEGVMAAVAAARQGIDTLLIMERENPGGLMTYGGLNYLDINYGPDGRNLNRGLFAEWHHRVGGSISFSIEEATDVFKEMLAEEKNLTVYNLAGLTGAVVENNMLKELEIAVDGRALKITAGSFIDASQNADLAVLAGVPYFKGGADNGVADRVMAVTLVLHMGNIDWQGLARDVRSNKYGPSYINRDHAWGFVKVGQLYQAHHPDIKMRGLNIVLDNDAKKRYGAEAYINAMLIFNTEPLEEKSLNEAYNKGKKEANYVLDWLQKNVNGFERAELLDFPAELYVRESRHIVAAYQLKVEDLLANRIFADTIAVSSYPLDYQAFTPDYDGFVLFNPQIYGIPFRSLLPINLDNMLVVGRSSGYSSLAAASARVLPTGMAAGEAAGKAAAIAYQNKISLKELSAEEELITELQNNLTLPPPGRYDSISHIIRDEEVRPYLEELVSWGLVIAGYKNEFWLEDSISEREFAHLILKGLQRREAPILYQWVPGSLETLSSQRDLTRDRAAMLLLAATSHRVLQMEEAEYFSRAVEEGLMAELIIDRIKQDRRLTRKEAYILVADFITSFPLTEDLKLFRGENSE